MLRGNHESVSMNVAFNFRKEVLYKYNGDTEVFDAFTLSFQSLPLAADVDGDYFCMHGGISPELTNPSDIDAIDRFQEPPEKGLYTDLLWADPALDSVARKTKYKKNPVRQCSHYFGFEPLKQFLLANNYLSVIRAHEVQIDGYKFHRWGGH